MRVGVFGHRGYDELSDILDRLLRLAPELGMEFFFEQTLQGSGRAGGKLESSDSIDALVTLGGDGTMLRGARFLDGAPVPVLGVNLGRLGFLTTCGADQAEEGLRRLATGDYVAQARMALSATAVDGDGRTRDEWRALNDFVLHKGGFARVVRLRIEIDDEPIGVYAADGIIISTPTGSTAYSLSAGGPVVVPRVESILLTPISAHTLAVRPLVIPPDTVVTLAMAAGNEELLVTVDGQVGTNLVRGEKLVVRRSDRPVLIVRFPGSSFFQRMRVKLGWGGLPERDEPQQC